MTWSLTVPLLPEVHEPKDLIRFLALAEIRVRIAEELAVGILSEEGQDSLPSLAPARDIVFLDERIFPEERDRVEIKVERGCVDDLLVA